MLNVGQTSVSEWLSTNSPIDLVIFQNVSVGGSQGVVVQLTPVVTCLADIDDISS